MLLMNSVISCDQINNQMNNHVQEQIDNISDHVAQEQIKQYNIAKKNGSDMDAYVQASMVSAAFLQAKDEVNYKKWKKIEKELAKKVGLNF